MAVALSPLYILYRLPDTVLSKYYIFVDFDKYSAIFKSYLPERNGLETWKITIECFRTRTISAARSSRYSVLKQLDSASGRDFMGSEKDTGSKRT